MLLPESKKRVIHAEDDIGTSKLKIRRNEEPHLPHISIVDKAYEQISSIRHVVLASAHLLVNMLFLLSRCFLSHNAEERSKSRFCWTSLQHRHIWFLHLPHCLSCCEVFDFALISSEIVAKSFFFASCNNQTECNARMQTTEVTSVYWSLTWRREEPIRLGWSWIVPCKMSKV